MKPATDVECTTGIREDVYNDPDSMYCLDDKYGVIDLTDDDNIHGMDTHLFRESHDNHNTIEETTDWFNTTFNEGDYLTDENLSKLLKQWQKASAQEKKAADRQKPLEELYPDRRVVEEVCIDGFLYKAGLSVELFDDSFLRIIAVLENDQGEVFLRGRRLFKMDGEGMDTCTPQWPNEVVWVVADFCKGDVPLPLVKRFCAIRFSNWCFGFPKEIMRKGGGGSGSGLAHGEYICRLKRVRACIHDQCVCEGSVEFVKHHEADDSHRVPPSLLRELWRQKTWRFGDACDSDYDVEPRELIDLTGTGTGTGVVDEYYLPKQRRYTFGDAFCGTGGMSRGAEKAGLALKWAFDKDGHAVNSYRLNFGDTSICEQVDVFDFLREQDQQFLRVDITHGSPPCQTFSPAHTVEGVNDDENSACVFSCADLVRKAKPRIHTMEETCGLLDRHTPTFFSVVQDFVEMGYSVRWKVLNCIDYGVPQSRRRLILIASGYGVFFVCHYQIEVSY